MRRLKPKPDRRTLPPNAPDWTNLLLVKADDWPNVEVLPPLAKEERPGLSDAAVSRIFELIYRDTSNVASTYQVGDLARTAAWFTYGPRRRNMTDMPVFAELVQDRLPLLNWYTSFRWHKAQLELHDWVSSNLGALPGTDSLNRRNELQQQLDRHRMQLWPTIRRLLLTSSMQSRIKRAAQWRVLKLYGGDPAALRGGWILRSPARAVRFLVGGVKTASYSLHWVFHEYGVKFLLLKKQRQRVRKNLIERAIIRALDVQKKVEVIEAEAENARWARLPVLSSAPSGWSDAVQTVGAGVTLVSMDESQKESGPFARLLGVFSQFSKKRQGNGKSK